MRSILHVGQHKTGTTSIQHYLKCNREVLIKRGLYVASSIAGYKSPSHFILNIYALEQGRFSRMKERFLDEYGDEALQKLHETLPVEIATHYAEARAAGCKDIIWSNEGLYLLNSEDEYKKLSSLFSPHSTEQVCLCCFRDLESCKTSYRKQHQKLGIEPSKNPDSYRYLADNSWLFDYPRKRRLLSKVFDKTIFFDYSKDKMVERFMEFIGYPINSCGEPIPRLNVTDAHAGK